MSTTGLQKVLSKIIGPDSILAKGLNPLDMFDSEQQQRSSVEEEKVNRAKNVHDQVWN